MHGVLNLDKPPGLSSARAVDRVKRLLTRGTKIGHAGTLDPFATGVLLLLIGRATRTCEHWMAQPKQYLASLKLGATTETLDPESPEVPTAGVPDAGVPSAGAVAVTREQIEQALPRFIGRIMQRPPLYSAMKVGGRRAYELVRKGKAVALEPRPVEVYGIEIRHYDWPTLTLRIDCGRGTYIRSLARDLGEALGTGAYLTALRRTRIGPFTVESAVALDSLDADRLQAHLHPVPERP